MTIDALRPTLVVIGAALGLAAVALAGTVGPLNTSELVIYVAIGWSFVGAGTVAWIRRPENLIGPLMAITGVVYLARDVMWLHTSVGDHLNVFLLGLFLALIAHQLVIYPHGRIRSRMDLTIVCAAYVLAAVGYIVTLNSIANGVANVLAAILAVVILIVLMHRWRAAGPPGRRALAPISWAAPAAVAIAVLGFVRDSGVTVGTALDQIENNGAIVDAAIPIAFLIGLLRLRLRRAGVTDLVVELSNQPSPGRIRTALAQTLGDPSLEVALWLPDKQSYVDLDGRQTEIRPGNGRAVSVLEHEDQPLAALVYDQSLLVDPSLVEAAAAAARLSLENARLQAELRAQLTEVRASRARILAAGDEERRRLERDLHDGAQQRLLASRLALQLARGRIPTDPETNALLDEADSEVQGALTDIRSLARGLHPALLSQEGLEPALAALARRSHIPVEITDVPSERLPASIETAVYFLAAEALTNTTKHAGASSVRIDVQRRDGRVSVLVVDDGVGGATVTPGGGLSGLCDRIEALGGYLSLESPAGKGTQLTGEIPFA
jgi:signal transduction histidine kinase